MISDKNPIASVVENRKVEFRDISNSFGVVEQSWRNPFVAFKLVTFLLLLNCFLKTSVQILNSSIILYQTVGSLGIGMWSCFPLTSHPSGGHRNNLLTIYCLWNPKESNSLRIPAFFVYILPAKTINSLYYTVVVQCSYYQ